MLTPDNPYFARVQLLVQLLPQISHESVFALKGGTAINLFVRDLPRLSVDIDLAYLPIEPRNAALVNIQSAMAHIAQRVEQNVPGARVRSQQTKTGEVYKLIVQRGREEIIIETSPVLRGAMNPPIVMNVVYQVEQVFGYASIAVLSFDDLYAGKLCAALDRQHPRDLFDVKVLYEHEGLSKRLHRTFLVYLISGNRPIAEMLQPQLPDLRVVYERQFLGTALTPVNLEELVAVRERLIKDIHRSLIDAQKQFLMSFKRGEPDWGLWGADDIEHLPALQWKLQNIKRIPEAKHQAALRKLESVLYG